MAVATARFDPDNLPMGTVTTAFARTLVRAAGLELAADGRLLDGDRVVLRLPAASPQLPAEAYFELVDWVRIHHPDRVGLPFAYAAAVDIDNLGALGLAIKTAPTLRGSLQRVERYFRILTDTVAYRLHEDDEPSPFELLQPDDPDPVLDLRNECALCGFGRVFKEIVGPDLAYGAVTFRHAAPGDSQRYAAFFGCPVHFGADRNAIVIAGNMLDLPTRLGDPAVSRFLTEHLDAELGALAREPTIQRSLAEHLSRALSNGIPKAESVARAIGMSERTLYRRLSEAGLTYQDVLENTQKSLAESLLSQGGMTIAEVSFLTGFSEQSTFSRAFKRWVGQTPGAYRRGGAQPA